MKDSNANGSAWRRALIVALLPLTILFWMTGWTFYWLGDQQTLTSATRKETVASQEKEDYEKSHGRDASPQQIFS